MFDLFRSRTKAVRYLLGVLLGLVALSMVVTLIPGFGTPTTPSQDVIAEIGDTKVSARQVHQLINAQMREGRLQRETVRYFVPQMITQMVGEFATMYQAQQMGLSANDSEVSEQIQMMLPQLFQDGKFVGSEAYSRFLQMNGMSIPEFEGNVRKQILLKKLQALAFEGSIVSPVEVEKEFQRRNLKMRLEVAKFSPEEYKAQAVPSRAEIEDFYNKNKMQFQSRAKRGFDLLVVDETKMGESIEVPESALRAAYAQQTDRWRTDERVHVRHILLKTEGQSADDKAKQKAKAEDLLKQLKGGADFAELAKKNSQDPGSATRGGDLDWITKGQTVPPFEQTSFSLKPKDLSGIVETQFGYHIIQVLEKEAGKTKSFDEVKAELTTEARRRQLFERMPAVAEQAKAELAKAPAQAEQIAKRLNLTYAHVDKAAPNDPIPQIGINPAFDQAVHSQQKSGVTDVIQLPGNKLVVAAVTEVFPPAPSPLSEVEGQIKEMLSTQKAAVLAVQKSAEFGNKLNANGRDFQKTVKELKPGKLMDTKEFTRMGNIEGVGSPMIFGEILFTHPVGNVVGPYQVAQTTYFYRVTERKEPDMSLLPAQREEIVTALRGSKTIARRELFEDGLVQALTKKGKVKVHQDALTRLLASYGG